MGFCVLHYDKQTGSSPGLSQHIERGCYRDGDWIEYHPTNVDQSRTHLNRELISGGLSRDERISKRIKEAGIKPRKDQVRALTVIMSASLEDMQRIEKEGNFDAWCQSSIKWAQDTHGEANVVSAVLHMDETTPHLHVTIVPIVQGISKDQIYRQKKAQKEGVEQKKKRKNKMKGEETLRLCAADVMARTRLKEYQTSYAAAVQPYGLERGIEGSAAKHVDINDWYKGLVTEAKGLATEVQGLKGKKDKLSEEIEDLNSIKAKAENAVKNTAKGVGDAIASIGKGIGQGLKEMGTYALPSKARDKAKAAEKRADESTQRAQNEYAKRVAAESERDKMKWERDSAQRERDSFILNHRYEINNAEKRKAQIASLQKAQGEIVGLMEDAAAIGLSTQQTLMLYRGKEVQMDAISLPEYKNYPITPSNATSWKLKFQHQLQIFHDKLWRPVKDWVVDARKSMHEWLREQEETKQRRGVKR